MSGHTPGPWTVGSLPPAGWRYICDSKGETVAAVAEWNESGTNSHDDLLAACKGGPSDGPDFLEWIADRLVHVHGESPNVDYVLSLRDRAAAIRTAAEGK